MCLNHTSEYITKGNVWLIRSFHSELSQQSLKNDGNNALAIPCHHVHFTSRPLHPLKNLRGEFQEKSGNAWFHVSIWPSTQPSTHFLTFFSFCKLCCKLMETALQCRYISLPDTKGYLCEGIWIGVTWLWGNVNIRRVQDEHELGDEEWNFDD